MESMDKPPVGIKPERFHDEDRAIALINALDRFISGGGFRKIDIQVVWCHE